MATTGAFWRGDKIPGRGRFWGFVKEISGNTTLSRVTALGQDQRVDETARMLAGDKVTDAARAAARALLAR